MGLREEGPCQDPKHAKGVSPFCPGLAGPSLDAEALSQLHLDSSSCQAGIPCTKEGAQRAVSDLQGTISSLRPVRAAWWLLEVSAGLPEGRESLLSPRDRRCSSAVPQPQEDPLPNPWSSLPQPCPILCSSTTSTRTCSSTPGTSLSDSHTPGRAGNEKGSRDKLSASS